MNQQLRKVEFLVVTMGEAQRLSEAINLRLGPEESERKRRNSTFPVQPRKKLKFPQIFDKIPLFPAQKSAPDNQDDDKAPLSDGHWRLYSL